MAEDPVSVVEFFTKGIGLDGVLIAAATKSNSPVNLAADLCRKRGRIVLIMTGLKLDRQKFYEKELTFQAPLHMVPDDMIPFMRKK